MAFAIVASWPHRPSYVGDGFRDLLGQVALAPSWFVFLCINSLKFHETPTGAEPLLGGKI